GVPASAARRRARPGSPSSCPRAGGPTESSRRGETGSSAPARSGPRTTPAPAGRARRARGASIRPSPSRPPGQHMKGPGSVGDGNERQPGGTMTDGAGGAPALASPTDEAPAPGPDAGAGSPASPVAPGIAPVE